MDITVNVDNIDLNTVIGVRLTSDYEGDIVEDGDYTIGDKVVENVTRHLIRESAAGGYPDLRNRIISTRDELIRDAVEPLLHQALAGAITQTNTYGEPNGKTTTMRELIMAEVTRQVGQRENYGRGKSLLETFVEKEVTAAFRKELSEAVKVEKEKAVAVVRAASAKVIADALKEATRGLS